MGPRYNLTGKKFGLLTVVGLHNYVPGKPIRWLCNCECGNTKSVVYQQLVTLNATSCGCVKKERQVLDLSGRVFGRLTVQHLAEKPADKKTKHRYYLCICECGGTKIVSATCLLHGNTRSCGQCKLGMLPGDEAAFRQLLGSYKKNARHRGLPFDISTEAFRAITKQDCHYCGVPPTNTYKHWSAGKRLRDPYIYNGIDRIDSTKGYTEDNVVPCCTMCNRRKMESTISELFSWVKRVYEHSHLECQMP